MKAILVKSAILITLLFNVINAKGQWINQTSGTTNHLHNVRFVDPNTGWAVGNNGTILKTTNGGALWLTQTSGTTVNLYGLSFMNASTGYAAGDSFKTRKTIDGGNTWSGTHFALANQIKAIHSFSGSTVIGVGHNTIFKTTNSFSDVTHWGSFGIQNGLFYVSSSVGWTVGNGGSIIKLSGTPSFTNQTSGTTNDLLGVHFTSTSTGYVVGKNGTILKTTNGGTNWISLGSGTTNNLNSVFFINSDIGYVVGDKETILKTSDGGATWTPQLIGLNATQNFNFVWFIDSNKGWIVGSNGQILHTTNGGTSDVGIASSPSGNNSRCSGLTSTFQTNAINATTYEWVLTPSTSGTFSSTTETVTITWNSSYNGNSTLKARGSNGEMQGSFSFPLTIFGNPTNFSLSTPTNGVWTTATPTFTWMSSSGHNFYQLYIDGLLFKDSLMTTSYECTTDESLTGGMHTWYVVASNGCTTQSNETRSFLVDATPPTAFDLTSPANNSWTTELKPTLSWNASSDAQSGLAKYQLWINGTLDRDNISPSATSTTPVSNLSNGSHTWQIRAVDNVGNVRISNQTWTVKVDNLPPFPSPTCLYFPASNPSYVIVNNSSSTYQLTYNYTIEAWIKPLTGGTESPRIISKQVDEWGMDGDYSLYLDGTGNNRKITFWMKNHGNIWSSTFLGEQWYHVAITISGNSSSWQIRLYINGSLENNITRSGTIFTSTNSLVFGRKGNGSNYLDKYKGYLDEVRFWSITRTQQEISNSMNKPLEGTENGLFGLWRFNEGSGNIAYNHANINRNGEINSGVSYSNSPLIASDQLLLLPSHNQYLNQNAQSFKWRSAYDNGVGFSKYQLWLDNNLIQDNIIDTAIFISNLLSYGSHTWFLKSFDLLGNNSTSAQRTFYIDNAPPNPFTLTSPANNAIVNLPTPNLSWQSATDSSGGSGLRKYQLWINGVVNRDSIAIGTTTVSPANVLPQGGYTWFVKAFDNVGNVRQSTEIRTFYVDWEPPTNFTLVQPANNQTISNPNPTFTWIPSSDIGSGLSKYELCISGLSPIIISPTETSHTISTSLPNNTYSWHVKAYDVAGAFTSSNIHTLIISVPLPGQAATPTGVSELCINAPNTDYSTAGASNAISYSWQINPSGAGVISGTSQTATVDWSDGFAGSAEITVKGQNSVGFGLTSSPFIVTVFPATVAGSVSGSGTICLGVSTGTLTLSGYAGNIIKWQKRVNGGSWVDIENTMNTYSEIPATTGTWEYRAEVRSGVCTTMASSAASVIVGNYPGDAATISGAETVCQGQNTVTYSVPTISNATSYIWTLPVGATGTSTTNSITVHFGTAAMSGDITVKGINNCGEGAIASLPIVVNPLPASAGAISGATSVCQGQDAVTYSAPDIVNATSYIWTLPVGATGTSTTNSITVHFGTTAMSGNITVKGMNDCGEGTVATLPIVVNPLPASAGTISGTETVCQGQNAVTYSIPDIANAISYVWTLPVGATGTSTTNSITVHYGTAAMSGNITVKGINDCGEGFVATLPIVVNPLPASAGTISGTETVCQGQNAVTYSIPDIANSTSYIWTLPFGASGTSTTNSITVHFGTAAMSGDITVKGVNDCGEGSVATLPIVVNPLPAVAGQISGDTEVCQGQFSVNYSTALIENASSYEWTLPDGATGSSSTNIILVNYSEIASSGNISVRGINSCGFGLESNNFVYVNPLPENVSAINGETTVCQGQSNIVYSVSPVANATSYEWTLPTGVVGASTTNTINVNYTSEAVSGNILAKALNSCGEGEEATLQISVQAQPATPIINNVNNVLYSNAPAGNQWFNQDGAIQGATGQSYTVTENGDYYSIVTLGGCPSLPSNTISVVVVSIPTTTQLQHIKAFPNPVHEIVTLEIVDSMIGVKYKLYNSIGYMIAEGNLSKSTILDMGNYSSGIYFLMVESPMNIRGLKLIKL